MTDIRLIDETVRMNGRLAAIDISLSEMNASMKSIAESLDMIRTALADIAEVQLNK